MNALFTQRDPKNDHLPIMPTEKEECQADSNNVS